MEGGPVAHTRPQGFFRIIKNQGGGGPLPQNPLPPSPDQSDHRGKKRNLQKGKSGQAIFGTPNFVSKTPFPPPPPCSKEALPGPPAAVHGPFDGPFVRIQATLMRLPVSEESSMQAEADTRAREHMAGVLGDRPMPGSAADGSDMQVRVPERLRRSMPPSPVSVQSLSKALATLSSAVLCGCGLAEGNGIHFAPKSKFRRFL